MIISKSKTEPKGNIWNNKIFDAEHSNIHKFWIKNQEKV